MSGRNMRSVSVIMLGAFLAVPGAQALAATGDGGGWSGKGGERTPMTVDSCVQRTGKTADECQTMIDTWKTRSHDGTEGQWKRDPVAHGQNTDQQKSENAKQGKRFGMDSTHRFAAIQARLDRVISFLKSKSADTSTLENHFAVLKEKMTTAQTDFTALKTARTTWQADQSADNQTARDAARTTAKVSSEAVKTYYHEMLLPLLKSLLQSVA